MNRRPLTTAVAALVSIAAALVGCTTGDRLPDARMEPAPTTTEGPPGVVCTDAEAAERPAVSSYEPLAELPGLTDVVDDEFVQSLRAKGKLVVGISPDTLLFGARNLGYDPAHPNGELPYEGFDIDMLVEVAIALFGGDRTTIGEHLEFVAIPYSQRLPKLISNEVDIVAHTMTINCRRWKQIAFSAEYFFAGQRILVAKGSKFETIDDLNAAGASVCVPAASTNEANLIADYPDVQRVVPADISDCLVLLQQGTVDAVTGDDTVLAGLAAQDPAAVVLGDQFSDEPYGLGINQEHVYFVQFVNRVLADVIDDGRWMESYQRWLVPSLTAADAEVVLPTPDYTRPVPGS